jgi:hypothetical protein
MFRVRLILCPEVASERHPQWEISDKGSQCCLDGDSLWGNARWSLGVLRRTPDCWRLPWPLFLFLFFDCAWRWQQDEFAINCPALSLELLCQRVPAFGADIVFLAVNLLLQTIPRFAAKVANNHGFSPESRCNGFFFSVNNPAATLTDIPRGSGPSGISEVTQRPEAGEGLGLILKAWDRFQQTKQSKHFQHPSAGA